MSSLGSWTYIYDVTIWPVTHNDYAEVQYGTPYKLKMDYMAGGNMAVDASGSQFLPASTYFFEAAINSSLVPKVDDYIIFGDYTSTLKPIDVNAERIKSVRAWPMQAFGANELPDWQVLT